jgi:signal transduction histidine kinase
VNEAGRLAQIQKGIQEEISALREFTHQLHTLEIDSDHLLGYLSNLAAKFACENGISAKFVCDVEEAPLRPRVCGELARIMQEALVNVRKHSGAAMATGFSE